MIIIDILIIASLASLLLVLLILEVNYIFSPMVDFIIKRLDRKNEKLGSVSIPICSSCAAIILYLQAYGFVLFIMKLYGWF